MKKKKKYINNDYEFYFFNFNETIIKNENKINYQMTNIHNKEKKIGIYSQVLNSNTNYYVNTSYNYLYKKMTHDNNKKYNFLNIHNMFDSEEKYYFIKFFNNYNKITQQLNNKIKIYNGEIYLQNNHILNGMKHLNEDIDIFLFFKYLVNLEDPDFLYTYQKELNFSRLDRIMLEWKLNNITNDTSNILLRINNVKNNLDNYPPLNRKYKSLN